MKKTKKEKTVSSYDRERIEEAEKDYQKMWEQVKPFIKKRKIKEYSTIGEWRISSYES